MKNRIDLTVDPPLDNRFSLQLTSSCLTPRNLTKLKEDSKNCIVESMSELRNKPFTQQTNNPKPVCESAKCYLATTETFNYFVLISK